MPVALAKERSCLVNARAHVNNTMLFFMFYNFGDYLHDNYPAILLTYAHIVESSVNRGLPERYAYLNYKLTVRSYA